ncbi:BTAD domain-containing putative transcriptional regulator [Streptomyces adonidis]|uniref:BTAD domain-containing putative transcriptional regulator n=1 Tax=Streptomyces adonidis TaxID=3231367 RepID=UPI0034DB218F
MGAQVGAGARSRTGARYEFGILGPLTVVRDGERVAVGAAQLRVLIAALAVDAGQVVGVDALVDRLWGDEPPQGARNAVQNYVLRVRRVLGAGVLLTDRLGYVLAVAPDALDAHRFGVLVGEGRAALAGGLPERAAELSGAALGLWRGEALADLPAERFPDVVAVLSEQRLAAQELWIDSVIACRRPADALPELRRLTELHPLRERFWAQRMLALYRCGRQGEALACFRRVSELLAEELGIDPGAELRSLHQRMLTAAPELDPGPSDISGPSHPVPAAPGNLPAETTSFVGREKELAEAGRLLERSRLVTLTGTGGVGKTRLALRTAARSASAFPDGVWLADLAALTDPALLERAVAESLGLRDQSARSAADAVDDHLRHRRLLLVLDNCEHLVDAVAALVLRLLRAAPGLRVLATSRERLGVPGEHLLRVPCLTLRDGADGTPSEAVRLLVDRSTACAATLGAEPDDRPDRQGTSATAELCRRLDGIPLAIELAAVRLSSLTVEEVLERLEDRFRLLSHPRAAAGPSPGRYRNTLRGVLDWSHSLCTPGERLLWARLSVFVGGFDLRAAEAVCTGEGIAREDVLDLVDGLVHKSVVTVEHQRGTGSGGGTGHRTVRYRLLETIRQYGTDRLRAMCDDTRLRIRHSEYYRSLTTRAAAEWCGPDEVGWLVGLRQELPNFRSALDFCRLHPDRAQALPGTEIAIDLMRSRCWFFASTLGEARHWVDTLAARLDPAPDEPVAVMAATVSAFIATLQGDHAAAAIRIAAVCPTESTESSESTESTEGESDGPPPITYIKGVRGLLMRSDPACVRQLALAREGLIAAGLTGDAHMATMFWSLAATFLGEAAEARAVCDLYVAEAEAARAGWAITWSLWTTGLTELLHGDPARALMPLCDALVRQHSVGDNWGPAWTLETLGWTIGALGHHTDAVVVLGTAHGYRRVTGAELTGLRPVAALHDRTTTAVREHLAAPAYTAAWERGVGAEDGIALALGIAHEVFRRTTSGADPE